MKKALTIITIFALVLLAFTSCVSSGGTENQGGGSATNGSSSNLGDYNVVIESSRLATDYAGEPIIIVKYTFTNNDDEPAAFWTSLSCEAYQDGIGLNECLIAADSANYSTDNMYKQIKKGATLSVEVAYELNDETTDVEIEVSEWFSLNEKKVTKTFTIR